MTQALFEGSKNRLLARVSPDELRSMRADFESVPLEFGQVFIEARAPFEYAYFPTAGILSAIAVMKDGDGIEVATIGNEGMLGLPGYTGIEVSPYRIIVQGTGHALRIRSEVLKRRTKKAKRSVMCWRDTTRPFSIRSRSAWPATACIPSTGGAAAGC